MPNPAALLVPARLLPRVLRPFCTRRRWVSGSAAGGTRPDARSSPVMVTFLHLLCGVPLLPRGRPPLHLRPRPQRGHVRLAGAGHPVGCSTSVTHGGAAFPSSHVAAPGCRVVRAALLAASRTPAHAADGRTGAVGGVRPVPTTRWTPWRTDRRMRGARLAVILRPRSLHPSRRRSGTRASNRPPPSQPVDGRARGTVSRSPPSASILTWKRQVDDEQPDYVRREIHEEDHAEYHCYGSHIRELEGRTA